jgi:REP element-mobilizing transposase RayT
MRKQVGTQITFEERRKLTRAGKPKKRPGPKPAERANVRHRERPVHKDYNPMHVTMRAVKGLPSFRQETLFAAFERAVRWTRRADFRIVEFSVQDNHLHLIVEADDKGALASGMKSFSVRANRLFNAAMGRGRGRVWGDRYHRRDLTSPRQVRNAIVYCLQNFKKHQNIPTGKLTIDGFSSARWFAGWSIERTQSASHDGERPGEKGKTFLLNVLWKRHGLIHPGERPLAPN